MVMIRFNNAIIMNIYVIYNNNEEIIMVKVITYE